MSALTENTEEISVGVEFKRSEQRAGSSIKIAEMLNVAGAKPLPKKANPAKPAEDKGSIGKKIAQEAALKGKEKAPAAKEVTVENVRTVEKKSDVVDKSKVVNKESKEVKAETAKMGKMLADEALSKVKLKGKAVEEKEPPKEVKSAAPKEEVKSAAPKEEVKAKTTPKEKAVEPKEPAKEEKKSESKPIAEKAALKDVKTEQTPAKIAEAPPRSVEEPKVPKNETEVATAVEKKPHAKEETPQIKEEAPKVTEETPKIVEETPKSKEEETKVKEEPAQEEKEAPKAKEETPKPKETAKETEVKVEVAPEPEKAEVVPPPVETKPEAPTNVQTVPKKEVVVVEPPKGEEKPIVKIVEPQQLALPIIADENAPVLVEQPEEPKEKQIQETKVAETAAPSAVKKAPSEEEEEEEEEEEVVPIKPAAKGGFKLVVGEGEQKTAGPAEISQEGRVEESTKVEESSTTTTREEHSIQHALEQAAQQAADLAIATAYPHSQGGTVEEHKPVMAQQRPVPRHPAQQQQAQQQVQHRQEHQQQAQQQVLHRQEHQHQQEQMSHRHEEHRTVTTSSHVETRTDQQLSVSVGQEGVHGQQQMKSPVSPRSATEPLPIATMAPKQPPPPKIPAPHISPQQWVPEHDEPIRAGPPAPQAPHPGRLNDVWPPPPEHGIQRSRPPVRKRFNAEPRSWIQEEIATPVRVGAPWARLIGGAYPEDTGPIEMKFAAYQPQPAHPQQHQKQFHQHQQQEQFQQQQHQEQFHQQQQQEQFQQHQHMESHQPQHPEHFQQMQQTGTQQVQWPPQEPPMEEYQAVAHSPILHQPKKAQVFKPITIVDDHQQTRPESPTPVSPLQKHFNEQPGGAPGLFSFPAHERPDPNEPAQMMGPVFGKGGIRGAAQNWPPANQGYEEVPQQHDGGAYAQIVHEPMRAPHEPVYGGYKQPSQGAVVHDEPIPRHFPPAKPKYGGSLPFGTAFGAPQQHHQPPPHAQQHRTVQIHAQSPPAPQLSPLQYSPRQPSPSASGQSQDFLNQLSSIYQSATPKGWNAGKKTAHHSVAQQHFTDGGKNEFQQHVLYQQHTHSRSEQRY